MNDFDNIVDARHTAASIAERRTADAEFWRYPVESMQDEHVGSVAVDDLGDSRDTVTQCNLPGCSGVRLGPTTHSPGGGRKRSKPASLC